MRGGRSAVTRPVSSGLGPDAVEVDAAAVVGDLDVDLAALVERAQRRAALGGLARGGALPRASRSPWSTALRTRCVSGSLMASMIVLSSSVSSPSISSRTCLPHEPAQVADDARELVPHVADRLHARLHDAFLQLGGDQVEALGAALSSARRSGADTSCRAGCGPAPARRPGSSACRAGATSTRMVESAIRRAPPAPSGAASPVRGPRRRPGRLVGSRPVSCGGCSVLLSRAPPRRGTGGGRRHRARREGERRRSGPRRRLGRAPAPARRRWRRRPGARAAALVQVGQAAEQLAVVGRRRREPVALDRGQHRRGWRRTARAAPRPSRG